ncbi:MAG: hypothetical protein O7A71_07975 [Chloroflexi bacterium]|nr:hypothetical protein [Chloroflexota bacterium]
MAVERSMFIDAHPDDAYDAAREFLSAQVEDGAFAVYEDVPGERWGIKWRGLLASSRYLFEFRDEGSGTTVDAKLWLSGLMGPVHSLVRRRGNRSHIDGILRGVKDLAESAEFQELAEDEDDDEPDLEGAPETDPDADA